jgi:hypothetical protein
VPPTAPTTVTITWNTGALFVETIVQVNPDIVRCALPPGVTSQTGAGTVTIT